MEVSLFDGEEMNFTRCSMLHDDERKVCQEAPGFVFRVEPRRAEACGDPTVVRGA
jgi:hypothetical protein